MKIVMKLTPLLLLMQLGTVVAMDTMDNDYARFQDAVNNFNPADFDGWYRAIEGKIGLARRARANDWVIKLEAILAKLERKNDPALQREADDAIALIKQAVGICTASDKAMTQENQEKLAESLRNNLAKSGETAEDLRKQIEAGICEHDQLERFTSLKPIFDCGGNLPADFKFAVKEKAKTDSNDLKSTRPATSLRTKIIRFATGFGALAGVAAFITWKFIYPRYKTAGKQAAGSGKLK